MLKHFLILWEVCWLEIPSKPYPISNKTFQIAHALQCRQTMFCRNKLFLKCRHFFCALPYKKMTNKGMCKFIPIIFVLSWIFSIFLNKITNSASYKFIPVILHFSWIFSGKSIKLVQVHSSPFEKKNPEYFLLKLYMLLH